MVGWNYVIPTDRFFLELLVSVGITFTVGPVGLSHCGSRTIKNTVQNLSKSPDGCCAMT